MPKSPEEYAHLEWIGYVQPIGLIVSVPAMLEAQCYINKNIIGEHARFLECLPRDKNDGVVPEITDFAAFASKCLEWEAEDLVELSVDSCPLSVRERVTIALPQYHEVLRPTHVVFEFDSSNTPTTDNCQPTTPLMLIQVLPTGTDFDEPSEADSSRHWHAAPQLKFERLLREAQVPIGLLSNCRQLRLVYAPRGESSGHATFNVDEMVQVAGRPMFAAFHMLLSADRMFTLGEKQRLPAILANSRKYQNTVSTKLAEQVLAALYELMRGFQSANDVRKGELLRDVLASDPNQVYSGLLRVLMRLVFVLYAEDRDLMSGDAIYSNNYSITGLFERLREDAGRFPDTMDSRFGAWSQLLTLFRLVFEGGRHDSFKLPARKGYLFDPDRYPFLEGRGSGLGNGGLGLGDWDTQPAPNPESQTPNMGGKDHDRSVVPRSSSVAVGDGFDSGMLSGDEELSQGRTLRTDKSDSESSQFDTGEHRGGTREGKEGIPAVPQNRSRQSDRAGNASDDCTASGDSTAGETGGTSPDNRPTRSNAQQIAAKAAGLGAGGLGVGSQSSYTSPNAESPIPNPQAQIPRISDGVVYRVLRNLLILDGERLSYRTLDVEQIGSVYETMMGFNLEVAQGEAIAIKPVKSHGAPATINLDELLATKGKDRAKWIKDQTDQNITGQALKELKDAESIDELLAALDKNIAKKVTPRVVLAGSIVLQPSDERRRSGSHYTPRSLTKPIVETTLQPILKQLVEPPQVEADGDKTLFASKSRKTKLQAVKSERDEEAFRLAQEKGSPHPRQILNLKVCDPAMGSGAFLVETCRQLGDELVTAWHAHECVPTADIPPDEDEILYARRLIAQRCLYGVDKNPMAVDLTKLSLWLATLAKDHPFTFLDHSLRYGDSLVGLTADQIAGFTWEHKPSKKKRGDGVTFMSNIQSRLESATDYRRKILDAREDSPYRDQESRMALAEEALSLPRLIGDACISAFFSEDKKKAREERRDMLFAFLTDYLQSGDMAKRQPIADAVQSLRAGENLLPPFHWEIEFPEVFGREDGGFDAFVGNPPFLGGVKISGAIGSAFLDWLKVLYPNKAGNADLVSYFFRRAFDLLRLDGTFGLIATNSIAQGDTRRVGLSTIREMGGSIYNAQKRLRWPGVAAVIVSTVHVSKSGNSARMEARLDGDNVERINAFMLTRGPDDDPAKLTQNADRVFRGAVIFGSGFILEPEEAHCLLHARQNNAQCIFHYLTGEDINSEPFSAASRFVINFGNRTLDECRAWPELLQIVEERVRPERDSKSHNAIAMRQKEKWWLFRSDTPYLKRALKGFTSCLAISQVSNHISFSRQPVNQVFSHTTHVFAIESLSDFAILQSRIHESWARFFGSSMKDDLRYNPTDCFEPFPLVSHSELLETRGKAYLSFRTQVQEATNYGMTTLYNHFHDPDESSPEIKKLRELHDEMDRAVLRAYGWNDLAEQATCEFLLDYQEDEDDDPTAKKSKKKKPCGGIAGRMSSATKFSLACWNSTNSGQWKRSWPGKRRKQRPNQRGIRRRATPATTRRCSIRRIRNPRRDIMFINTNPGDREK